MVNIWRRSSLVDYLEKATLRRGGSEVAEDLVGDEHLSRWIRFTDSIVTGCIE